MATLTRRRFLYSTAAAAPVLAFPGALDFLQDTLAFSLRAGVRPMSETYPLDRVSEAYDQMMSGKARFRVVLTIGE
jgi:D-arabinose 1-dehydrogenase-like Zn-dependent alcohol dehydrogenase